VDAFRDLEETLEREDDEPAVFVCPTCGGDCWVTVYGPESDVECRPAEEWEEECPDCCGTGIVAPGLWPEGWEGGECDG